MLIIGFIIAGFFIFIICMICRAYLKDIIELENRVLQLEKRIGKIEDSRIYKKLHKEEIELLKKQLEDNSEGVFTWYNLPGKEGEKEMACKKGKGGKKK